MKKLEELGTVIRSDVLIIGAGIAGLSACISVKELHPDLDVLVIEARRAGWAGLAGKSGHGMFEMTPGENDPEKFVEFQTRNFGEYLNDQDVLRRNAYAIHTARLKAEEWGVVFEKNPDGSVHHLLNPNGCSSGVAVPLGINMTLYKKACELGVRFLNHIYAADFVKNGDRISAALGYDLDDLTCYIFNAKSYVLATHSCQFNVQSMFNGNGGGIAMAYRAGAEMRNAEFGVANDAVYKNDGHPIYGSCESVYNAEGTNISEIYAPNQVEVSLDLQMGAEKEMQEGRGPVYVDLSVWTKVMSTVGSGSITAESPKEDPGYANGVRRVWPGTMEWQAHILEKAEKYRNIEEADPLKPLCSFKMAPETSPLRVDMNMRTSLPNLWGAGFVCYTGSASFEWIRGNGLSMCLKHGILCAPTVCDFALSTVHETVNPDEVECLKKKFLAPLERKGGMDPEELMDRIAELVTDPKYILHRNEQSLTEALAKLDGIRKDLPKMYAYDGHTLAKCHDWEAIVTIIEMMYRASLIRKETRVRPWRLYRDDYPTIDNKNWLKWIIIQRQEDGEMKFWTEDIPIERYKYRPDNA